MPSTGLVKSSHIRGWTSTTSRDLQALPKHTRKWVKILNSHRLRENTHLKFISYRTDFAFPLVQNSMEWNPSLTFTSGPALSCSHSCCVTSQALQRKGTEGHEGEKLSGRAKWVGLWVLEDEFQGLSSCVAAFQTRIRVSSVLASDGTSYSGLSSSTAIN